jgi:outer membrane protein TolC
MRRLAFLLLLASTPATADEDLHRDPHTAVHDAADGDAIGFADALGLAAALPELTASRAAADATAASARDLPRRWSPLTFRLAPQLGVGTPRGGGVRLALEQAIPLGDRRAATQATVEVTARRRAAHARALDLDARLEIAQVWIEAWAAAASLGRATEELELARTIEATTARAAAAGAVTAPEVADARALLAEAGARRLDAEGRVADTGFTLAAAIGAATATHAAGDLPAAPLPAHDRWPQLLAAAGELPATRARALEAAAQRARAVEERSLRRPELLLGLELTDDPGGDRRVAAVVGLALPMHDRGERERAEATAEALRLDGEAVALGRRARFALAQALHDVEHTGELLDHVEHALVPAVVDAARQRRRAFELGESTVLEVLASERAAVAGQRTLIEARAAHAWARTRAWLLVTAVELP